MGGREGVGTAMQQRKHKASGAERITHTQIVIYPQEGARPKKSLITDEYLWQALSLGSPGELISAI